VNIFLALIFLLLSVQTAFCDDADMHRKSAFLFAKRQLWNEAITHARLAHDTILAKYFTWEYLKDPESDASFDAITRFLEENPDWPDRGALEKHAEVALMANNPSDAQLNEWFSKHPPHTDMARYKITKDPEKLQMMIREAWVADTYDKNTEMKILSKYHSILRTVDHIHRIDRLLWEGNDEEAKRLLKYVSKDYQRLFQARMALAEDKFSAPVSLARVSKALKNDPGLIYERIRWHVRRDDRDGVRALLFSVPADVPYPEKWWKIRDRQVRAAIDDGDIKTAEKLLARHGQEPGTVSYKEVLWLQGWIALEFHKSPERAYGIFTDLLEQTETPPGKARVAYWAGRAAELMPKGNPELWFNEASHYSTTFYGQLAAWELQKNGKGRRGHVITESAQPTAEEKEHFRRNELVQIVYALAKAGEGDRAGKFIFYLSQNAKSGKEAILAAELGRQVNRIDFGVHAAKKALSHDIVSLENGWPVIETPNNASIEKPLLLALVRQESEFYTDAVSTSGACGLMQVLPATAKETARKAGISFSHPRIFDPEYNMTVGSIYMNKTISKFDNSYVLAVAGYNAGPNRVRQWVNDFGRPGHELREVVDWIEKLPTFETRNYIQHVFENLEVYRFLLAGRKPTETTIADDLVRR
jgi:soluble lytic murein transglycosylase